jgi:hypothetical protein
MMMALFLFQSVALKPHQRFLLWLQHIFHQLQYIPGVPGYPIELNPNLSIAARV